MDRQIIHALQLDPRASFSRIAAAVGTSEQTVARRYRRLRADGVLRVIALVDPRRLGQTLWTVRLQCRPDATVALAQALANRSDVGWVMVSAGGAELTCLIRSVSRAESDELLLSRLPGTSQVLSMTAHATLHQFRGGAADDWISPDDQLDDEQQRRLDVAPHPDGEALPLTPADQPLLDLLAQDGRASYARLATASGWSENRVARRLAALLASRTVYLDVDVAAEALGFGATASLWLTVAAAHLAGAGEAIAAHREVPYAAAVTGRVNLLASVVCRDMDELYRYVTEKIGAIEGIQQVEVLPVLRRIKQAGALLDGNRLAPPKPVARAHR